MTGTLAALLLIEEFQTPHRFPAARVTERQKRKVATDYRAGEEIGVWEIALTFGIVEIGEGAVCACASYSASVLRWKGLEDKRFLTGDGLVHPDGYTFEDRAPHFLAHHGGREKLPVGFGVQVSAVER